MDILLVLVIATFVIAGVYVGYHASQSDDAAAHSIAAPHSDMHATVLAINYPHASGDQDLIAGLVRNV